MGAFAMPALPTLSSFPSVRSFINTSPPLIYPSASTSSCRGADSPINTPTRRRDAAAVPRTLVPPSPSKEGHLEWERVDRSRGGSISFFGSQQDLPALDFERQCQSSRPGQSSSPVRPTHRRAQSAAPRRPNPSPMGRLHEISRNPLGSTSSVSLPTLCEIDGSGQTRPFPDPFSSAPASPVTASRTRRTSRPTPIEALARAETFKLDPPASPTPPCPARGRSISRSMSSVPPPNPFVTTSTGKLNRQSSPSCSRGLTSADQIVEKPKMKGLMRPPPTPRSWSAHDVDRAPKAPIPVPVEQHPHRRGSVSSISSTSSISDVAVMATWSFPSQPPADTSRSVNGQNVLGGMDQPTDKLRDRLRRLSMITTSLPISNSSSSLSASSGLTGSLPGPEPRLGRTSSGRSVLSTSRTPTQSTHRHTHSSPNALALLPVSLSGPISTGRAHPLLPPPRPLRRPTTSRLRQPNPLCMPLDEGVSTDRANGAGSYGSSPGSLFSDSRSTSGSDGEIVASPSGSVISLPDEMGRTNPVVLPSRPSEKSLFGLGRWRRGSVDSGVADEAKGEGREVYPSQSGLGVQIGTPAYEEREEQYLSLDDI